MPDDIFQVGQELSPKASHLVRQLLEEMVACEEQEKAGKQGKEEKKAAILDILKRHDLKSQQWVDGARVSRVTRAHTAVPGERWPEFRVWLQKNGYFGLMKVHQRQLDALLRERLEKEQEVPDYITKFEEETLQIVNRDALKKARKAVDHG